MKPIKFICLVCIVLFSFAGCVKQLPEKEIKSYQEKDNVGILSSLQNTIYVVGGKLFSYNKVNYDISSWHINNVLQEKVFNELKLSYKNLLIVNTSKNTILLPESFLDERKYLKNIMINQKLNKLILIKNVKKVGFEEPSITYRKSTFAGDEYQDELFLNAIVSFWELTEDNKLKRLTMQYTDRNAFLLFTDNKYIWKDPTKDITKDELNKIEQKVKERAIMDVLTVLKELNIY